MATNNTLPFGSASVSGDVISVTSEMENPTKITRTILNLAAHNFWADKLLTPGGDVQGGAVLYERPNPSATDLYPETGRGFGEIAPGDEAPILTFTKGVPMVAKPREIGGKFEMTRKALKRNDVNQLTGNMRKMANHAKAVIENMTIAELQAVIQSTARYSSAPQTWDSLAALTLQNRTGAASPLLQALAVWGQVEGEERGHSIDSMLINTTDWIVLCGYYGSLNQSAEGSVLARNAFAQAGITNIYVSPRYASGSGASSKVLFFEQGGVGELRWEFPLEELAWDDKDGKRSKWYQLDGSPCFVVTDQYAMLELRSIRA